MTKGKLMKMLCRCAKDYHKDTLNSITRNDHMNDYDGFYVSQATIDAIIVDFVNFVGVWQGIDLALYTRDLYDQEQNYF